MNAQSLSSTLVAPPSCYPTLAPSTPVEQLGEDIADLAARVHAATYELLVMLREFDEKNGWTNGFLSCAHWLHWRTGIDLGAAREKVRVAKALVGLPLLSSALQRGEISYAKVRALTRVATHENEARLLHIAYAGTAAHVERLARAWRRCDRVMETRDRERAHLVRSATTYVDEDGMVILRARLTPELGAVVQRALEAASEHLYQESKEAAAPESVGEEVTAAQRRADALALLAESALEHGLDRGTTADRYQVVMHVEGVGDAAAEQAVLELADGGIHVSAETSRRLSCDASLVVMREDADGSVLDVGRKTRTIPTAVRRALEARDKRCRFPGCSARRCDAHHIEHWADGGPTALDNLVLLCRRHHRLVHEGGYELELIAGELTFIRPNGYPIAPAPALSSGGALVVDPGIGARSLRVWDGAGFDVGNAIDVLWSQYRSRAPMIDRPSPRP
jgi:hypothetical protein